MKNAYLIHIDKGLSSVRPKNFEHVYVLYWESENIMIPWEGDVSPRKAMLQWALKEIEEERKIVG